MPFFAHKDFLASYSRANEVAQGTRSIFEFDQPLSHLVQVINLKLISPIVPHSKLPLQKEYEWPYEAKIPNTGIVHRALFMFKLPYLLFELATLFVLGKILVSQGVKGDTGVKGKVSSIAQLIKLWMLNPLIIFTFYIYGRYDAFVFFVLALVLLLLKKQKNYLAATMLGAAVLFRVYPLMLVPIFVLIVGKTWAERIKYLLLISLPYATWLLVKMVLGVGLKEATWLVSGPHQSFMYSFAFELAQGFKIYPFFLGYFGLLVWLFLQSSNNQNLLRKTHRVGESASFAKYSLVTLLLFLSLSTFLPNYPVWVFPFLVLFLVDNPNLKKLHTLQILSFAMILPFWNNPLFLRLLSPVSEQAFYNFPVQGLVSLIYPAEKVINLGKTLFTTVSLFMVWELLKPVQSGSKNET